MSIEQATDTNYNEIISNSNKTVLVDFWAEWCGPCRMLTPVLEAIATKYESQLAVYKLNTDENPKTAQEAQITSIPCCILYKEGKEVLRIIGHKSQDAFEEEITPHLA